MQPLPQRGAAARRRRRRAGRPASSASTSATTTPAAPIAFEREFGIEYPSIYDPGSEQLLRFGAEYAPKATPSTYVLDREGRVAALISGEVPSLGTLRDLVEEVAAEDG